MFGCKPKLQALVLRRGAAYVIETDALDPDDREGLLGDLKTLQAEHGCDFLVLPAGARIAKEKV